MKKQVIVSVVLSFFICQVFAQTKTNYNIVQFGAIAGGKENCTQDIQQAINTCNKQGGGSVYVPAGVFKIGTIFLQSNVQLYVETGAILKGSENLADYFEYTLPAFGKNYYGLIYADSIENASIAGNGIIDGNNQVFFDWNKAKKIEWGGTKYTRQKELFRHVEIGIGDGPVNPKDRPRQMIVFAQCKNIDVKDVQLLNSPFWTLHFAVCDGVSVSGIRLFTNMLVPNADGIDVTSCTNVTINNCDIRAGDDAIAITGYNHHFEIPGYHNLKHTSENIVITNCNLQSNSSAIRIGFLDQNTVKNVLVNNVNISHSNRGIGIFVRDEGSLENLIFSNIIIQTALKTGDWWGNGEPIHISAVKGNDSLPLGKIKQVQFNNIICTSENGILLYGSKESVLEDISFNNVHFTLVNSTLNKVAGGNIDLRGCALEKQLFAHDIPGMFIQHIKGLQLNDVSINWRNTQMPYFTHGIELQNFSNVVVKNVKALASPINKMAVNFFVHDGNNLAIDNIKGIKKVNVF
jgi:polygalacturonase